jgi:hypothetical protein
MLTLSSANGVYRLRSLELHDTMMLLHLVVVAMLALGAGLLLCPDLPISN